MLKTNTHIIPSITTSGHENIDTLFNLLKNKNLFVK